MFISAPHTPVPKSRSVIVLPFDDNHCAAGSLLQNAGNVTASGPWTTANTAVIYEFYVWEPVTVYKLGWANGSATGGNADVALYNAALTRLVSAGSTARVTSSVVQWIDVADTALSPGVKYYAALNHSQTTANNCNGVLVANVNIGSMLLANIQQQAVGATALPDPLVPAAATAARMLPGIFIATVSGVS